MDDPAVMSWMESDGETNSGDSEHTSMSIVSTRPVTIVEPPRSRSGPRSALLAVPAEIIVELARYLSSSDLIRLGTSCRNLLPICITLAYEKVADGPQQSLDRSLSHAMTINSTSLLLRVREAVMRRGRQFQIDRPIASIQSGEHDSISENREPMLTMAVACRNYELAELLLATGAEVDVLQDGQTPLGAALLAAERRQGHICPRFMVTLLVKYGANVIAPAETLMRMGPCRVHEESFECFIDMGERFLRQPEVSSNPDLQEKLVEWLGRFPCGPTFSPQVN